MKNQVLFSILLLILLCSNVSVGYTFCAKKLSIRDRFIFFTVTVCDWYEEEKKSKFD